STERHVSPYYLALAYCYLGDNEKALAALNRAVELKEAWLNWLGVEPALDPLRGDSRFDDVLEKTGYGMYLQNFSASGAVAEPAKVDPGVYDLTTLVIAESEKTDDGIRSSEMGRRYAR